jgi:hypothetical protein
MGGLLDLIYDGLLVEESAIIDGRPPPQRTHDQRVFDAASVMYWVLYGEPVSRETLATRPR